MCWRKKVMKSGGKDKMYRPHFQYVHILCQVSPHTLPSMSTYFAKYLYILCQVSRHNHFIGYKRQITNIFIVYARQYYIFPIAHRFLRGSIARDCGKRNRNRNTGNAGLMLSTYAIAHVAVAAHNELYQINRRFMIMSSAPF